MKTNYFLTGLLLLILLSGCRTYGDFGAEEAMYHQILLAIDELESETADFERRLGAVRGQLPVDEHDRMASSRADLVQEYRAIAERLSPRSGHRELRRIYGSIISDKQILYDQLARLEELPEDSDPEAPLRIGDPRSKYQVVPVFYHRLGLDRRMESVGPSAQVDTTEATFETAPAGGADNVEDAQEQ